MNSATHDALMRPARTVCWFSCGAPSAVAAKIAIETAGGEVIVAYNHVIEEHPDNLRFLADCEKWLGVKILRLMNEEYDGSIYQVFSRRGYLVGPSGASCTRLLKKKVRQDFERPDDVQVFGYTVEEQRRVDNFIDANFRVRSAACVTAGHAGRGGPNSPILATLWGWHGVGPQSGNLRT
ncbi:MAG: hypothetical protein KDA17_05145 [Candidatus Saccharibacteria bacterium]|nr:hypothetical protein [Candidatus Saccharibacteria bacterium]